ncbi:MAG: hypothetical protein ACPL1Y_04365, partial [Thermoplasmata archaeon]
CVEIVSVDKGPGIENIEKALKGKVIKEYIESTGALPPSLGCGLAGVKELADNFEIQTGKNVGTRVRALFKVRRMEKGERNAFRH